MSRRTLILLIILLVLATVLALDFGNVLDLGLV